MGSYTLSCINIRHETAQSALATLKEWGATALLTLMPREEMAENQVESLPEVTASHGMQWFHLPIADADYSEALFIPYT